MQDLESSQDNPLKNIENPLRHMTSSLNHAYFSQEKENENFIRHTVALLVRHPTKLDQYVRGSGVLLSADLVLTSACNVIFTDEESQSYQYSKTQYEVYQEVGGVRVAREVEDWRYLEDFKHYKQTELLQFDYALIKLKPIQQSTSSTRKDNFVQLSIPCSCFLKKGFEEKLNMCGRSVSKKSGNCLKIKEYNIQLPSGRLKIYPEEFGVAFAGLTKSQLIGSPIVFDCYVIGIFIKYTNCQNIGRLITSDMIAPIQAWAKQLNANISFQNHQPCKSFRKFYSRIKGATLQEATKLKRQGEDCKKQYEYQLALENYTKSLKIYEQLVGQNSYEAANLLINRADVYQMRGQVEQSLSNLQKGLAIYHQREGEETYNVGLVLGKLGWVYHKKGQLELAFAQYNKSMDIMKRLRGINSIEVAYLQNRIASVYQSQGYLTMAHQNFQKSLSIYQKVKGKYRYEVSLIMNSIGEIYDRECNDELAFKYFSNSLQIKQSLNLYNAETGIVLSNNGIALYNLGKYIRSIAMYKRSIALFAKLNLKNSDYANAHSNLGIAYEKIEDYKSAAEVYRIALAINEQFNYQTQTKTNANLLAQILRKLGEQEELNMILEKHKIVLVDHE